MNDEQTEQQPTLDLPWLLAGSFIVLLAGYAFIIFAISFVAGTDDIRFLGDVAAFILIFAVAMLGVLLFVAANEVEQEMAYEPEFVAVGEAGQVREVEVVEPGACPSCRQVNPEGANFCYHCGTALT
jgi:hypothetical protein